MQTEPIISIKNVSHDFTNEKGIKSRVLSDISLEIRTGEFISLVGPSGCGKSTLLRIMGGLISPSTGSVDRHFKRAAMVFQDFALFPWLTVLGNVEYGLIMQGYAKSKVSAIAHEKIHEVGLSGHEHRYPHQLSGGMRQRVSIARALAISPDILFMDEPFSSLDPFTADILKKDLLEIWKKYSITVVMVSHIIEDAVLLSDRVVVMSSHPGKIIETALIPLARPRDSRTPEFYRLFDEINKNIKV